MCTTSLESPNQYNPQCNDGLPYKTCQNCENPLYMGPKAHSPGKLAVAICREVIAQLETSQENRALTEEESELKKLLKNRILGIVSIERSMARQQSRLTWIKKGDVNTKYFHIMPNIRRKNNFIPVLNNDNEIATSQQDNHRLIFEEEAGCCSAAGEHYRKLNEKSVT
jgi:hypothetical protein